MRLFVALDIDPAIRERLGEFRSQMKQLAPAARWVGPETFHVTLKFIGEQTPQRAEEIKRALTAIHAAPTAISFRQTGFFPNPRSARVFWVGIGYDDNLARFAKQVEDALSALGIPPEDRPFAPHLTLARAGDPRHPRGGSGRPGFKSGDRPNALFAPIQEKLATGAPPEFGSMTANEFFLFESKLSPAGAHYTKLERFPLA